MFAPSCWRARADGCGHPRLARRPLARCQAAAAAVLSLALAPPALAGPLTYHQALERAAADAPEIRARDLAVEAARAAAPAAGQLPDPELFVALENFPISGPMAGSPGADEMTMVRVGVMQAVPSAARRQAERQGAAAEVGVAEMQARVTSREVRVATALAWLDLYYAKRRREALDEALAALEPLWDAAPAAVASGQDRPAGALSPVRLKVALEDRRSALVAAEGRARAELARWTGEPEPQVAGPPPQPTLDEEALRAGLDRAPALRAWAAAADRADADTALARAGRHPDWSFELGYGRRDPLYGDMLSVGARVSLPLFANRRQDPVIAARGADARRVRVEREAAARALRAALEADLAEHRMHHEQGLRARDVLLPAALDRSSLETASYGAGRASLPEVIDAFTAVAEARLETLDREAMVVRETVRIALTYGEDAL
ncbi:TolC family protein [Brevundimonas sp.]|uniref:TolC family protein n=1 Tax=Brevundimonas sp. TaxID=1871086 RepID=UPI0027379793|nr:TolC family protein [Brevundimonas sp.]MDP3801794.1 TolC family protein [Brevundimonas sp.]